MIFNANNKKGRTATTSSALPHSGIRKEEISVRLKTVDKLIREGNLDEAKVKLEAVRAMDPKNGYILALEERIEELRRAKDNPPPVKPPKVSEEPPSKVESDKIQADKTESDKIHADKTESDKVQPDKVESDNVQPDKVESDKVQAVKVESDNVQSNRAETGNVKGDKKVETEYLEKLTEEVHKFEERLEAGYRDKLAEETGRNEKRIADVLDRNEKRITDALKEVRDSNDAGRKSFTENFERLKEKLLAELKDEARKLFDAEFKKTEESYRKLAVDIIRRTVEGTRVEVSALYEQAIEELKIAVAEDRSRLLDAEREALIEETRKQTHDQLQKRFMSELARVESALASSREEGEVERVPLQADAEKKSEAELKHVEEQLRAQLTELKRASEERYRKSVEEAGEAPDMQLPEVMQSGSKSETETGTRPAEAKKERRSDLGIKTEEQLAQERELRDKLREMEFKDIRNGVNWKDRARKKKG